MEKYLSTLFLKKKKTSTAGETQTRSLPVSITGLQTLTYSAVQHQIDCIYCFLSAQSEIHGKLRNITSLWSATISTVKFIHQYGVNFHELKLFRKKNGGHQTYFLSGEQNLPLPPHILRIIQYKTLWSVLLKNLALTISKFFFS